MNIRTLTLTEVHKQIEETDPKRSNIEKPHLENSSPYEQVLSKNESSFMRSIRQWEKRIGFQTPLIWSNVISISLIHIFVTLWFLRNLLTQQLPMWTTISFQFVWYMIAGMGVTGGVHRYWSHRAYKQKKCLQILTLICYSAAGQNTVFEWVRDHRVHHKYSETPADPHDSNRGFFFSHVGWLMMKKHPEVMKRGKQIDMSDIAEDPIIQFHEKYFTVLKMLMCFFLPTWVSIHFWNETWSGSILATLVRYLILLNATWSVNSVAHIWGDKPYDRDIHPTENWGVTVFTSGEGWHNFHHTFPWDYKAAEHGSYLFNCTTFLIENFEKIGWTYDLKTASPELIKSIADKRGHFQYHCSTIAE